MANTNAQKLIINSLERNKVFHSYIFVNDTVHSESAVFLARKLLGTTSILVNHPSVIFIDGSSGIIKKEQVLSAIRKLQMTSTHDGKRVLFIKGIENGNKSSLNSLLKTIEEPMKDVYIIMTSTNVNRVLPTIASRSQVIFDSIEETRHSSSSLREEAVDEKWIPYYSQLGLPLEDVVELYESSYHKTLDKTIRLLSKALDNKSFISGPLNKLITKDNCEYLLNAIDLFYSDIWKIQQGIQPVFQTYVSIINAYASASFEYQKALLAIRNFLESLRYNVNFTLAKANMLVELEKAYG